MNVVNCVLPVFLLIGLGYELKRLNLIDDHFLAVSDRLIYYAFFPALLFWKIGKPAVEPVDASFIAAVLCSVFAVFAMSLLYARFTRMEAFHIGSFSQSCYRFSTYVGMAVVLTSLGDAGGRLFGVLIGIVIPCINVLAVTSMIRYSGESGSGKVRWAYRARALAGNPLILGCVGGIVVSRLGWRFPTALDNTLALAASMSLPLALLSIGGSLTLKTVRGHLVNSMVAAGFKFVVLPVVGLLFLSAFQVTGPAFQVAMIYLALPTSPNNYILSSQLNSDVDLAAAAIAVSTLISLGSLSVVLQLVK